MKYLVKYNVKSAAGDKDYVEVNTQEELFTDFKMLREEHNFKSSCIFNLNGRIDINYTKFKLDGRVDIKVVGTATPVPDDYNLLEEATKL